MTDGQSWAAQFIDTSGGDMSDQILVQWEVDGGYREGVLMCVFGGTLQEMSYEEDVMLSCIPPDANCFDYGIIYDRHRNERAIVPLSKVTLVEKRCQKCGGEGVIGSPSLVYDDVGKNYRAMRMRCDCQAGKAKQ